MGTLCSRTIKVGDSQSLKDSADEQEEPADEPISDVVKKTEKWENVETGAGDLEETTKSPDETARGKIQIVEGKTLKPVLPDLTPTSNSNKTHFSSHSTLYNSQYGVPGNIGSNNRQYSSTAVLSLPKGALSSLEAINTRSATDRSSSRGLRQGKMQPYIPSNTERTNTFRNSRSFPKMISASERTISNFSWKDMGSDGLKVKNERTDICLMTLEAMEAVGVDTDKFTTHGGRSALMVAIISGNLERVKHFYVKGMDVNKANAAGETPLSLAKGNPEIYNFLKNT